MEQERLVNQDQNSVQLNDTQQREPPLTASESTAVRIGKWAKLRFVIRTEIGNIQLRLRLANFILQFCPALSFVRFRTVIYRLCGVQIGRGTAVIGNLNLSGGGPIFKRLKIGQMSLLNAPIHLDLNAEITIGNGVEIGHHVVFITTDHHIGPASHRCGANVYKPIIVGDGCWIGACTTILPGVRIGAGAVVGAGALVTKDVAPDTLVVGVPARMHRYLGRE